MFHTLRNLDFKAVSLPLISSKYSFNPSGISVMLCHKGHYPSLSNVSPWKILTNLSLNVFQHPSGFGPMSRFVKKVLATFGPQVKLGFSTQPAVAAAVAASAAASVDIVTAVAPVAALGSEKDFCNRSQETVLLVSEPAGSEPGSFVNVLQSAAS